MRRSVARTLGASAVGGGLLLVLTSLPSRLYGAAPGDSYVFDPAFGSGLWFQRRVLPVLFVLAVLGSVLGLAGLLLRDRDDDRWHDVAGGLAVFAGGALVAVEVLLAATGSLSGGAPDLVGSFVVLVAALGGLLGLVVLAVTLVVWGVRYRRRGRTRLGTTLALAPVATVLAMALAWGGDLGPVGGPLVALSPGVAAVLVGRNLWVGEETAAEESGGQSATEPADERAPREEPGSGDGGSPSDDATDPAQGA
jgi:hypothetical protein